MIMNGDEGVCVWGPMQQKWDCAMQEMELQNRIMADLDRKISAKVCTACRY
jgi:hypothetical protein